jgi:hypothetical protein
VLRAGAGNSLRPPGWAPRFACVRLSEHATGARPQSASRHAQPHGGGIGEAVAEADSGRVRGAGWDVSGAPPGGSALSCRSGRVRAPAQRADRRGRLAPDRLRELRSNVLIGRSRSFVRAAVAFVASAASGGHGSGASVAPGGRDLRDLRDLEQATLTMHPPSRTGSACQVRDAPADREPQGAWLSAGWIAWCSGLRSEVQFAWPHVRPEHIKCLALWTAAGLTAVPISRGQALICRRGIRRSIVARKCTRSTGFLTSTAQPAAVVAATSAES